MSEKIYVKDEESLLAHLKQVREAQKEYSTFTQEQVDKIFYEAALAANKMRIELAKEAVEETGMGVVEDKVIKNHYAAEYIYNKYKHVKTCGVVEENISQGYKKILEPIGVIAAIVPTTNPTSTAIFKALICLKTRNGCIFSPHPRAKKSTIKAAKVVLDAAVKAGAPENIIGFIDEPSVPLSSTLMKESDCILATGGPGMVKAAYSSGKPAIGVGAGNTPAVVDSSADIKMAAASIVHSKSFDNGIDVDVLTHEFGHAFQGYMSRNIKCPDYHQPTLEACEIHSMSMEFITYPWMNLFFGENEEKYRYTHLADAITFIPYGVTVDEFQHWVYENPEATHQERCAKWREIEKKYLPHRKYDEAPILEKGGYWMRQGHIFQNPFYYIDYTLAQVVAFQFFIENEKNHDRAWKKYVKLCKMGGKYPFTELLQKAHLNNPFVDGTIKKIIRPLTKYLRNIDISKY